MLRVLLSALAFLFLTQAAAQPAQERRVALVIGVSDYEDVADLANPGADAQLVHDALVATGFSMPAPLMNPTKAALDAALIEFSRSADGADVAVLYFAGHGMAEFDDNWLIPRDARLQRRTDIQAEGVPVSYLLRYMARAQLRIIFLDACRDNPFIARLTGTRTSGSALERIDEASAGPNQRAPDDGAYARALAANLVLEGITLEQMLDRVNAAITRGADLTPEHTIRLERPAPFYFVPPSVSVPILNLLASAPTTEHPPGYAIPAGPYLARATPSLRIVDRNPINSELIIVNNRVIYNGRALRPTMSENFLTQINTGNVPASFTLEISPPARAFQFTIPRAESESENGITFPAWRVTAFTESGAEVASHGVDLAGSLSSLSVQTFTLEAQGNDRISRVRFESDPNRNGRPFAAFSAIHVEHIAVIGD